MMVGPQIVGVLLKKPGQKGVAQDRSEDTKIRGELYVEELGERRIVSIRMGWLWVEGTPMRLALRALNLRQTSPGICHPHALALGFTLSNSKDDPIATFWADSEAIYWSWVRAIAAELVRQTPFRAQRCLNFLEILTICPRGPVSLPESPSDVRRRSRSELRCWPSDSPTEKDLGSPTILEDSRRRTRSELRCWSSSNSSDEDLMGEFRSIPHQITKISKITRTWGCSESSEGSDDSLPWTSNNIITTNMKSLSSISFPEAPTREQRIQRYKEARRRENEARTKRVLEEDARRRKARALESNAELTKYSISKLRGRSFDQSDEIRINDDDIRIKFNSRINNKSSIDVVDSIPVNLPPIKPNNNNYNCHNNNNINISNNNNNVNIDNNNLIKDYKSIEDSKNNNNLNKNNNNQDDNKLKVVIVRTDSSERRSRARERRNFKSDVTTVLDNNERLNSSSNSNSNILISRIPVSTFNERSYSVPRPELKQKTTRTSLPAQTNCRASPQCEKDVARLLERCQRVDHYVPVKEKLTLFESLSRLGGRLARSTEDLGRAAAKPSPTGKQRASSLHDLNRAIRTVPVREMCRLFENNQDPNPKCKELNKHPDPPCVRASTRRKQYHK